MTTPLKKDTHGTRAKYQLGCYCKLCTEASKKYNREHHVKLIARRKAQSDRLSGGV